MGGFYFPVHSSLQISYNVDQSIARLGVRKVRECEWCVDGARMVRGSRCDALVGVGGCTSGMVWYGMVEVGSTNLRLVFPRVWPASLLTKAREEENVNLEHSGVRPAFAAFSVWWGSSTSTPPPYIVCFFFFKVV